MTLTVSLQPGLLLRQETQALAPLGEEAQARLAGPLRPTWGAGWRVPLRALGLGGLSAAGLGGWLAGTLPCSDPKALRPVGPSPTPSTGVRGPPSLPPCRALPSADRVRAGQWGMKARKEGVGTAAGDFMPG